MNMRRQTVVNIISDSGPSALSPSNVKLITAFLDRELKHQLRPQIRDYIAYLPTLHNALFPFNNSTAFCRTSILLGGICREMCYAYHFQFVVHQGIQVIQDLFII